MSNENAVPVRDRPDGHFTVTITCMFVKTMFRPGKEESGTEAQLADATSQDMPVHGEFVLITCNEHAVSSHRNMDF